MTAADAKSFVRNILPVSSLTSEISWDFLHNLLIPQDRGGGGYLILRLRRCSTGQADRSTQSSDSRISREQRVNPLKDSVTPFTLPTQFRRPTARSSEHTQPDILDPLYTSAL